MSNETEILVRDTELDERVYQRIIERLIRETGYKPGQIQRTLELFGEGATIPFIARYRKEVTGALDEVQLANLADRYDELEDLEKRRIYVLGVIDEQGKLTPKLRKQVESADDKKTLEDLYLPYKPKRRTRAQKAREAGLEPIAERLLSGDESAVDEAFEELLNDDFPDKEAVLAGARDIVAERISEDLDVRDATRNTLKKSGRVKVRKGKKADEDKEGKYDGLFEQEPDVRGLPGHRYLAYSRAENEGVLTFRIDHDASPALRAARDRYSPKNQRAAEQVNLAIEDGYERLLKPSLEAELRREMKEAADLEAIDVFARNLEDLLMQAPLGGHAVIGIDPGYRTGCKVALVDPHGDFVTHTAIFPHEPRNDFEGAADTLAAMMEQFGREFDINYMAYGNGTASRETDRFLKDFRKQTPGGTSLQCVQVNESGASIYSASEIAREEFPDLDLTVRGAISIARRMQDPLAELIKLDPKSIGVGQYQHDVDQKLLEKTLGRVVETCVNRVGVDLNTASWKLLTYVAGLSERLAKAIVEKRRELGGFTDRRQLLDVAGMGPKTYEQCAGFLRIRDGDNVLDNTAVHPERYELAAKICRQGGLGVADAINRPGQLAKLNARDFVDDAAGVGLPTVEDIIAELRQPGRDPRGHFEKFEYEEGVENITDLEMNMVLPGIVTNITKFGCFVDVGVHQDGLVHISEIANKFVEDPADEVSVGQKVRVKVVSIDVQRKRIGLSMKQVQE